jgi:hypothetical protein
LTREEIYWSYHKIENDILYRRCSSCNEWYPETIEYFYMQNKKYPEKGFTGICKRCAIEKSKLWVEKNIDKMPEVNKRRNATKAAFKRRQRANKKRKMLGLERKWRIENPDKVKYHAEKHRDHDISTKEWNSCLSIFDNSCVYCGISQEEAKK